MLRLTARDLREALRFLAGCDGASGVQAFAASVTAALPAVIPCDVAVFGMANPRARILQAVENPRVTSPADLEVFVRHRHPLLAHFATTGEREARRMSDFVTRRELHALPIYNEFYAPLRLEHQLGIFINHTPAAFDGVTANRTHRDFSERDRSMLTVLRPHIVQAYRTAMTVDRLRADLAFAAKAIETTGFGLIVLAEGSGRMHLVSPSAAGLLTRYFGSRRRADDLPETLDRWVRSHTEAARDSSRLPPVLAPLVVEHNGQRLVVRLLRLGRDTLLMLEEPSARANWLRLASLGVAAREACRLVEWLREEVVGGAGLSLENQMGPAEWLCADPAPPRDRAQLTPHEVRLLGLIAEGHSYKTAAAVLGSSVNTIAFHMKHIFEKLQVHSKSEAVAKALREGIVQ
jgi:DNA-binding NarL/FixJ family response regulator